ncbi:MAG: M15 family metallopeptidase [Bacillota bacterium]
MKQDLLSLMMAYPQHIVKVEKGKDGNVYAILNSGRKVLYDDKKKKSFQEKLNNPDLQDMMEQIYPLSDIGGLMAEDFDPGRIRVYPLLKEVYGGSKEQVQANLVGVKTAHKSLPFNKSNGASAALKGAMDEVISLTSHNPRLNGYLFPLSGTFNYRVIAGTNQLSPHSFGIAIDLARDNRDYWRWTSREEGEKRLKSYPAEIVQTFEKYGFIWGGKWGHFDILHFEYRPEFIYKAKYFGENADPEKSWHKDIGDKDENIRRYIELIDEALK